MNRAKKITSMELGEDVTLKEWIEIECENRWIQTIKSKSLK